MEKLRRHPVAIAAGLIVAGVVALAMAVPMSTSVLDEDFSDVGPDPGWTTWLVRAIAIGSVLLLALRNRSVAPLAWGLAVAGLAVAVVGAIGFIEQYGTGFPGQRTLLAVVGGLAVAVGAVLLSRVPAGRWRLPTVSSGLFALGALLLVPVIAWPLLAVVPDWRLAVTTASAGKPAAVPESVSKVAWSTEVDGEIKEVVAGGMGAVVMLADGVAGFDGTTGEIRWSRRRTGAETERIDVSPDGRTVLLQVSPADRFALRFEVLDAFTGELRFAKFAGNDVYTVEGIKTLLTNASYVDASLGWGMLTGYSLTDGHKLWDFPMPDGCAVTPGAEDADPIGQANGFLLPLACEREFRYVSVDGTTGQPRWQNVVRFPERFTRDAFRFESSPDHTLAKLSLTGAPQPHMVVDTETGAVVSTLDPLKPLDHGLGLGAQTLVNVRSGQAIVSDGCVRETKTVVLSGGALCVNGKIMADGTVDVAAVRFGDSSVTPIKVPLGGPFKDNSTKGTAWLPVPGAVVGHSEPVAGARHKLVGLR